MLLKHGISAHYNQTLIFELMEGKEEKIAATIDHIITCIHNNTHEDVSSNIHSFARKVFSSGLGRPNTDTLQELKQRIITKVATTYDQHSVLQCQEVTQKFINYCRMNQKQEILRMLIKLSELNTANQGDLSSMFRQYKKHNFNATLDTNLSSISQNLPQQPPRLLSQLNQQLTFVRNRGSIEQGVTEFDLVKQLSFVFTNTTTSQIVEANDGYELKTSLNVSQPVRRMVNQIADLGWLHKRISKYSQKEGSIRKALRQVIHEELKQFYIWNSTMEGLIKAKALSLRRLYILSFYPEEILRWFAIILEAVQPFNGCHIISIVNSFRPSGLSAVDSLINRVLSYIIRPLLNYINRWIYMGELLDSKNEFFIAQNKKVYESEEWNDRFKLIGENIPNILNSQSAKMIFNAGKSIYFLKNKFKIFYNIKTPFIQTENTENIKFQGGNQLISVSFMNWLIAVHKEVNKVLVQTLLNQFHLKYHLKSIKNFFLCGKGDFIQHLYDTFEEILSQNKHDVSEHTLNGYISDAINKCIADFRLPNSNNYFKGSIADRLLSKKIEFTNGTDGWDCFNFQYSLEGLQPLQALFSPESMINYQKIFHFLWKLKKVIETLKFLWVQLSREESFKMRKLKNRHLTGIFHFIYVLRNDMLHFIVNLNNYLMVAIEQRWNIFWEEIDTSQSFDEILIKHKEFQLAILQIIICTPRGKNIQETLYNIFKVIKDFKIVYTKLQQNFDEYYQKLRLYEDRQAMVKRGIILEPLQKPQLNIDKSWKDARQVKGFFDAAFKNLYIQLRKEGETKVNNLNVLAAMLDFSEFYSNSYIES